MLHPVSEGSQAVPVAAARFHNRGGDISRVEGFSDCAFGFAVTLLVVSLEVPRTFDGLVSVLRGIPSFGVSFAVLAWIWFHHYRFFRRYGLDDVPTVLPAPSRPHSCAPSSSSTAWAWRRSSRCWR
jgi:Endosomal/lysosomal potassium channel TMEM175